MQTAHTAATETEFTSPSSFLLRVAGRMKGRGEFVTFVIRNHYASFSVEPR